MNLWSRTKIHNSTHVNYAAYITLFGAGKRDMITVSLLFIKHYAIKIIHNNIFVNTHCHRRVDYVMANTRLGCCFQSLQDASTTSSPKNDTYYSCNATYGPNT